ncbi:DUF3953 domain-containing protein [Tumebacillus lipolyticus]|uniref:DUF3953 domain-containing protein n=1 Tax=Tumebacillus lipolyticus TaxID=1280370 RepID=A0ABW4ZYP3_9BACL
MIRVILGIVVIVLSSYSLLTKDFEWMPYSMLFLGAFFLSSGVIELQKEGKRFLGYMTIVVSLFIFFVSIQGFLLQ